MSNPLGGSNSYRERSKGKTFEDVVTELEGRIGLLESWITWDKELREQHPALQDLYEKYQATKKLLE